MTNRQSRQGISGKQSKNKIAVFFGEDEHDARSLRTVFLGLKEAPNITARVLRKPISLVKGLEAAKKRSRTNAIIATVDALATQAPVWVTIFHEDADACEPAHVAIEREILEAYSGLAGQVIAAVPAWELETWWLLFPQAVGAIRESWRTPDQHTGKNVGKIRNTKEELTKCVRPRGKKLVRFHEYQESDSEKIAEKIVELGLLRSPAAKSDSWKSFVDQVDKLK